jgi:hypothetical protein
MPQLERIDILKSIFAYGDALELYDTQVGLDGGYLSLKHLIIRRAHGAWHAPVSYCHVQADVSIIIPSSQVHRGSQSLTTNSYAIPI